MEFPPKKITSRICGPFLCSHLKKVWYGQPDRSPPQEVDLPENKSRWNQVGGDKVFLHTQRPFRVKVRLGAGWEVQVGGLPNGRHHVGSTQMGWSLEDDWEDPTESQTSGSSQKSCPHHGKSVLKPRLGFPHPILSRRLDTDEECRWGIIVITNVRIPSYNPMSYPLCHRVLSVMTSQWPKVHVHFPRQQHFPKLSLLSLLRYGIPQFRIWQHRTSNGCFPNRGRCLLQPLNSFLIATEVGFCAVFNSFLGCVGLLNWRLFIYSFIL